jgi:hypothetical protein
MRSNVFASLVVPAGFAVSLIYGGHFKQSLGDVVLAQSAPAPAPAPVNICEGASIIPDGWVVTDEAHNSSCEYPGSKTVTGRMLQIDSDASAKQNLTPMTVCADAQVPLGFVVTAFGRAPNKCSIIAQTPNAPNDHMVKTIRYVRP